ncbi:hypothetical protein AVEN_28343-1, partial [Araneus ventricosus]
MGSRRIFHSLRHPNLPRPGHVLHGQLRPENDGDDRLPQHSDRDDHGARQLHDQLRHHVSEYEELRS